ncbi:MAG: VWA domain-containing protein [Armatimonadetes bacterium]|nr:VWA domain-containing protein [Armatimonadota bacterium]
MKTHKLLTVLASLAVLAFLAGCSGDFAQTLPSPDGVPAQSNIRFPLQDDQGNDIRGAKLNQFALQERPSGTTDPYRTARVTRLIETGGTTVTQANVMLNLDVSGSMASGSRIESMRDAAKLFVSLMRTNDRTAIQQFDDQWNLVVDFTSDKAALTTAIDTLYPDGLTAIWSSSMDALAHLAQDSAPGAKALVVMTDGEDNSSSHTHTDLINEAKRLGIPIYCIAFQVPSQTAEDNLRQVAVETGGQYFEPATQQDLQDAFFAVSQSTQASYQLFWNSNYAPGSLVDISVTYSGPGGPITFERKNVTVIAPTD